MEGSGNYGSSRAIWMGRTSHRTSLEWIVQRLLSLVPTAAHQAKGRALASGNSPLLWYVQLHWALLQ